MFHPTYLQALIGFLPALAAMLLGSELLVRGIDRLAEKLGFREGLTGLLTALGADSPEIASAVFALMSGASSVGVGIVLGSNLFNLAALLGVSVLVAGKIRVRLPSLLLTGGLAILATLAALVLVVGVMAPSVVLALLCALMVVFIALVSIKPRLVDAIPLPTAFTRPLAIAVAMLERESKRDEADERTRRKQPWGPALWIPAVLLGIVVASAFLVQAALVIAAKWAIPQDLVGVFGLAILTGLPNLYAAIHLARQGRSKALVSEAFNSNTLNVLIGLVITGVLVGVSATGSRELLEVWWLIGLTALAVILLMVRTGLHRWGGMTIIGAYLLFVYLRLFWF